MPSDRKHSSKILIIEDDKPMARALELKLAHEGYNAKAVYNGDDGIEHVKNENFDLILCDLVMPNTDGFMVLKVLKERKVKTPVIVLSNLAQEEDENKARALGAVEFFTKSDTPIASIVQKINNILKTT